MGEAGAGSRSACWRHGTGEVGRAGSSPCVLRGNRHAGAMGSTNMGLLFLPWFLPYLNVSPGPAPCTFLSPHFLPAALPQPGAEAQDSFHSPNQGDSRGDCRHINNPSETQPHHLRKSLSLVRNLFLLGPKRGTERADTAVSAFPKLELEDPPWQVSTELAPSLGSLGSLGCAFPAKMS